MGEEMKIEWVASEDFNDAPGKVWCGHPVVRLSAVDEVIGDMVRMAEIVFRRSKDFSDEAVMADEILTSPTVAAFRARQEWKHGT